MKIIVLLFIDYYISYEWRGVILTKLTVLNFRQAYFIRLKMFVIYWYLGSENYDNWEIRVHFK